MASANKGGGYQAFWQFAAIDTTTPANQPTSVSASSLSPYSYAAGPAVNAAAASADPVPYNYGAPAAVAHNSNYNANWSYVPLNNGGPAQQQQQARGQPPQQQQRQAYQAPQKPQQPQQTNNVAPAPTSFAAAWQQRPSPPLKKETARASHSPSPMCYQQAQQPPVTNHNNAEPVVAKEEWNYSFLATSTPIEQSLSGTSVNQHQQQDVQQQNHQQEQQQHHEQQRQKQQQHNHQQQQHQEQQQKQQQQQQQYEEQQKQHYQQQQHQEQQQQQQQHQEQQQQQEQVDDTMVERPMAPPAAFDATHYFAPVSQAAAHTTSACKSQDSTAASFGSSGVDSRPQQQMPPQQNDIIAVSNAEQVQYEEAAIVPNGEQQGVDYEEEVEDPVSTSARQPQQQQQAGNTADLDLLPSNVPHDVGPSPEQEDVTQQQPQDNNSWFGIEEPRDPSSYAADEASAAASQAVEQQQRVERMGSLPVEPDASQQPPGNDYDDLDWGGDDWTEQADGSASEQEPVPVEHAPPQPQQQQDLDLIPKVNRQSPPALINEHLPTASDDHQNNGQSGAGALPPDLLPQPQTSRHVPIPSPTPAPPSQSAASAESVEPQSSASTVVEKSYNNNSNDVLVQQPTAPPSLPPAQQQQQHQPNQHQEEQQQYHEQQQQQHQEQQQHSSSRQTRQPLEVQEQVVPPKPVARPEAPAAQLVPPKQPSPPPQPAARAQQQSADNNKGNSSRPPMPPPANVDSRHASVRDRYRRVRKQYPEVLNRLERERATTPAKLEWGATPPHVSQSRSGQGLILAGGIAGDSVSVSSAQSSMLHSPSSVTVSQASTTKLVTTSSTNATLPQPRPAVVDASKTSALPIPLRPIVLHNTLTANGADGVQPVILSAGQTVSGSGPPQPPPAMSQSVTNTLEHSDRRRRQQKKEAQAPEPRQTQPQQLQRDVMNLEALEQYSKQHRQHQPKQARGAVASGGRPKSAVTVQNKQKHKQPQQQPQSKRHANRQQRESSSSSSTHSQSDTTEESGSSSSGESASSESTTSGASYSSFHSLNFKQAALERQRREQTMIYYGMIRLPRDLWDARPPTRDFYSLTPCERAAYMYYYSLYRRYVSDIGGFQKMFNYQMVRLKFERNMSDEDGLLEIVGQIRTAYLKALEQQNTRRDSRRKYEASQRQLFSDDRETPCSNIDFMNGNDSHLEGIHNHNGSLLRSKPRRERDSDQSALDASDRCSVDSAMPREPHKHRTPHVLGAFGCGGQLALLTPALSGAAANSHSKQPFVLHCTNIRELIRDPSTLAQLDSMELLRGPLIPGVTPAHSVLLFIRRRLQQLQTLAVEDEAALADCQLVWRTLQLVVQQRGQVSGPDLAMLLLDEMKPAAMEQTRVAPNPQQLIQYRQLILGGHIREALEFAQRHQMWAEAMFFAHRLGNESVFDKFVAQLPSSDAVRTLAEVMSGRSPHVSLGSSSWREHCAVLLANISTVQNTQSALVCIYQLAASLQAQQLHYAAHFCLISVHLLGMWNVFEPTGDAGGPHIDLLYASEPEESDDFVLAPIFTSEPASIHDVQATEIYDYAVRQNVSGALYVPSVAYWRRRLDYACSLAALGSHGMAYSYCQTLAAAVPPALLSQTPSPSEPVLQLYELADRLHYLCADNPADRQWLDQLLMASRQSSMQPADQQQQQPNDFVDPAQQQQQQAQMQQEQQEWQQQQEQQPPPAPSESTTSYLSQTQWGTTAASQSNSDTASANAMYTAPTNQQPDFAPDSRRSSQHTVDSSDALGASQTSSGMRDHRRQMQTLSEESAQDTAPSGRSTVMSGSEQQQQHDQATPRHSFTIGDQAQEDGSDDEGRDGGQTPDYLHNTPPHKLHAPVEDTPGNQYYTPATGQQQQLGHQSQESYNDSVFINDTMSQSSVNDVPTVATVPPSAVAPPAAQAPSRNNNNTSRPQQQLWAQPQHAPNASSTPKQVSPPTAVGGAPQARPAAAAANQPPMGPKGALNAPKQSLNDSKANTPKSGNISGGGFSAAASNKAKPSGSMSWIGGMMKKILPMPPGQVHLPDDNKKSIYYDAALGRWVGDGVEDEKVDEPPPTSASEQALDVSQTGIMATRKSGSSRYFNSMSELSAQSPAPDMPSPIPPTSGATLAPTPSAAAPAPPPSAPAAPAAPKSAPVLQPPVPQTNHFGFMPVMPQEETAAGTDQFTDPFSAPPVPTEPQAAAAAQ